ncbi:MAG: flavin reductase family protein, partial [Bacteroidia bacterium]
ASGAAMFEVEKPITSIGIGIDQIPSEIKSSHVLSGNNLGLLGSVENLPTTEEITEYKKTIKTFSSKEDQHKFAKSLLEANKVKEAWMSLL